MSRDRRAPARLNPTTTPQTLPDVCAAGLAVRQGRRFVLTRRGLLALKATLGPTPGGTPAWDSGCKTLRWRGAVVLRLLREAPARSAVLGAFEAARWPDRINDPLPADIDSAQRLRDTVKNLNRSLPAGTIRFHTDGRGRGVRWEAAG